ncbi:hypothetical protein [Sphingomonas sp.]|uniref:hypothetical protein n=1 Tax=Sphingomonas sp. TaxID=28214 RepID=UPI0031DDEB61
MTTEHPISVGLDGDGDEIAAIEDVEAAFGVTLDIADAPEWATAGDVFRSLAKALPSEIAAHPDTWSRFAIALSQQTGIKPEMITAESPLLLYEAQRWRSPSAAACLLWLLAAGCVGILFGAIA